MHLLLPVSKKLPCQDLSFIQSGEDLEETLDNVRPVDRHHVELAVDAPEQGLDGAVVHRAEVHCGTLGHLGQDDGAMVGEPEG